MGEQKPLNADFVNDKNPRTPGEKGLSSEKRHFTWSGKKLFHAIIMCCMLVRGSFFLVFPAYQHNYLSIDLTVNTIWNQTGSILYFLAYFNLLLFWAQFYYQVACFRTSVVSYLKGPIVVGAATLVALAIGFVSTSIAFMDDKSIVAELDVLASGVLACLCLLVAGGFCYYGSQLSFLLWEATLSPRKRQQTRKVVLVSVGCTVCFVCRAVVQLITVVRAWNNFKDHGWNASILEVIAFFAIFEAGPIILMLFLLRKLPTWKVETRRSSLINHTVLN